MQIFVKTLNKAALASSDPAIAATFGTATVPTSSITAPTTFQVPVVGLDKLLAGPRQPTSVPSQLGPTPIPSVSVFESMASPLFAQPRPSGQPAAAPTTAAALPTAQHTATAKPGKPSSTPTLRPSSWPSALPTATTARPSHPSARPTTAAPTLAPSALFGFATTAPSAATGHHDDHHSDNSQESNSNRAATAGMPQSTLTIIIVVAVLVPLLALGFCAFSAMSRQSKADSLIQNQIMSLYANKEGSQSRASDAAEAEAARNSIHEFYGRSSRGSMRGVGASFQSHAPPRMSMAGLQGQGRPSVQGRQSRVPRRGPGSDVGSEL